MAFTRIASKNFMTVLVAHPVTGEVLLPLDCTAKALTNRSGTIAVGGTAQQLMAANAVRKGFSFHNLSANDLWISDVGTAAASQPSMRIPAGSIYESPVHGVPSTAISVFGATTAQAFAAREW